jgi:uncharacterized membrane protein YkoI
MMKTTKLLITIAIGAGLACGTIAQAGEKHDEETISSSDVPAAVQKAAEAEAKGGKVVSWEKEGNGYEALIEKNGKKWEVKIDANGKVLKKHEEDKEEHHHGEKD